MKPIIAIVGRPNVGKSTLFNKIIGRKKAITHDEPGVTRDLNFADTEERARTFTLVDTGGFVEETKDVILRQVKEETILAIEEADLIILLMDGRAGPTPDDKELVGMLRKSGKPVLYAVNKVDTPGLEPLLADFYSLGIKDVMPVSAESGMGVNELIDAALSRLPEYKEVKEEADRIKVAIVGRPNVGKSSILNRLIGKKRALVSPMAGTTRDAIDAPFESEGRKYLFVDTAGIRKKDRVSRKVEVYSVMEAVKSIERCDAAVLVIDGGEGVKTQDEKIAGLIEDRGKCCVIAVNKWDIVEKDTHTMNLFTGHVREKLQFLSYAPVVFVSALSGQRVPKILELIDSTVEKSRHKAATSKLNKFLEEFSSSQTPPVYRGMEVKFYYITQIGVAPPMFIVFTNHPEGIKDHYKRFFVSSLRESLGFDICPVRVIFRKRE